MKNMIGHIANGKGLGILLITLMLVIASTMCSAERLDSCRQKPLITLRTNTLYDRSRDAVGKRMGRSVGLVLYVVLIK